MKFLVHELDTNTDEFHNDFHESHGNYVSNDIYAKCVKGLTADDYETMDLDDLVGLSEIFEDHEARSTALRFINHGPFNLRAINLIMGASSIKSTGRSLQDLALVSSKLHELGLGYISEKTYLLDELSQYRLLIKDFMKSICTITMSEQVYKFVDKYLTIHSEIEVEYCY